MTANNSKLVNGTQELLDGSDKLAEGMQKLFDGSVELKDGLVKFNEKGIRKLAELYEVDVKDLDGRIEELKEAASSYRTFSGAPEDMESSVKFIIKADAVG